MGCFGFSMGYSSVAVLIVGMVISVHLSPALDKGDLTVLHPNKIQPGHSRVKGALERAGELSGSGTDSLCRSREKEEP